MSAVVTRYICRFLLIREFDIRAFIFPWIFDRELCTILGSLIYVKNEIFERGLTFAKKYFRCQRGLQIAIYSAMMFRDVRWTMLGMTCADILTWELVKLKHK